MPVAVRNLTEFVVDPDRVEELCVWAGNRIEGVPEGLSVVFVDDETIADLHERYYGEPGVTDVLAFPYDASSAEVLLNPYQHRRQAPDAGNSLNEEVAENLVHALLHLGGYDHTDPSDQGEHLRQQGKLMDRLREGGVPQLIRSTPDGAFRSEP